MTKILFINNDGGGFADYIEIEPGTTILKFFNQHVGGRIKPAAGHSDDSDDGDSRSNLRPENYLIRVNRQLVPADYVLQNGDRVSVTPNKIEGAIA